MKPFILLLTVYIVSILAFYIATGDFNTTFSGRLALSVMLIFTAIGHFKFTAGMVLMVPDFVPQKKLLVLLTGIFEIAFAMLIMIAATRYYAALVLLAFLIVIFPANINAAFKAVNYEQANFEGPGPAYLFFRIPLQFVLLFWVYIFCL
ncbi:hypothetical protein ACLI1A_16200 [Flavobacterium sp. RHBU_3]|uniref:DoxX family protein n=1 Tax=Flavobacterium sp. RHBU_3 TaxID=3391184 RepID=UPI0039851769